MTDYFRFYCFYICQEAPAGTPQDSPLSVDNAGRDLCAFVF